MIRKYQPMSNDEIQQIAPSAFAVQPYEKQSDRYAFIPTVSVIDGLRANQFLPVMASQSRSRIDGKQFFTKHMIRFRAQNMELANVGDSVLEAVLVNSHDGTSAYTLSLGVFRLVCANGLVIADSLVERIHVRHTGNVLDRVIEGTTALFEQAPKVAAAINRWRQILLSDAEQVVLAESVHSLRFEDQTRVQPAQLLAPRRTDDTKSDLWTVTNRLQENTVRGGLRMARNENGRRGRTREVTGIDQNNSLNRAIWSLSEKMAELKS